MVSVNFQNNVKVYQTGGTEKVQTASFPVTTGTEKSIKAPAFKATAYTSVVDVRTSLTTSDEKKKYKEISSELNLNYRKKLEFALKSGILLKNDSDDKTSVLDNLHKILKEERDPGLDGRTILKECLDIIENPYVITQTCEDIPDEYKTPVLGLVTDLSEDMNELEEANYNIDNMHTGTCPTASIEFDLATKKPAEFFRMVEGLTSPKNETYKVIDMNALSEKTLDAVWLLNKFKTPHQKLGFEKAVVLLKPDEHAIVRARIQNNHRDKGERSIIDVLMQSTMMQLGSQQTYNSLTDKRAPNAWTQEDGGLIDFEKTYVESVMENKNTVSVIYQKIDQDGKLVGHEKDFATIKQELLDTLNMGHNIIIGYTWPDPNNDNKLAGHEITIVGAKTDKNGETIFICQDSDDNKDEPIEMKESFLLPKIHHAGLPQEIAERDFQYEDSWKIGLNEFNQQKK
ncbi:MAG: hypothetical protein E7Z92_01475 [Cyanobacteria bacterium SIG31]|nr:hypothetical protein [Cyanobacteria bacterium SIG31]